MDILGISCYFHDASAALVRDGRLIAAAEEERFSRKKHDYDYPAHAIDFCLSTAGIAGPELDYVVFFEKPFVKFERLLLGSMQTFPASHRVFREAMVTWLGDKLWVRHLIQKRLGIPASKILFSEHHLSHAASAFFCSPFEEAAILTVDGVGEWTTASLGIGKGTDLRLLKEIRFPHSLGLLYSAFTAFLGFEVNEGEYKVMGMAPFGTPRYADDVRKLLRVHADGSFELDMDYFTFHRSTTQTYSPKFETLFGPPRDPAANFFTASSGYPSYFGEKPANYDALARENERYADVAASIQLVIEETMLTMARAAHRETGLTRLCLAGGVALNSVANSRILRETPFEELYIQPAAGDGGGAVGAAFYGYHAVLGRPRAFVMEHASWGQEHDAAAIESFLRAGGIAHERIEHEERLIERVVDRLQGGRVVGWSRRASSGARRASVTARSRRPRQPMRTSSTPRSFREPSGPSTFVPRGAARVLRPAHAPVPIPPVMLYVVDVREDKRALVPPSPTSTAPPSPTVRPCTNPRYHRLIRPSPAR